MEIVNDQNLWIEGAGIGIVKIKHFVEGKWLDGMLHGELHIPELRTNYSQLEKRLTKAWLVLIIG